MKNFWKNNIETLLYYPWSPDVTCDITCNTQCTISKTNWETVGV